MPQAPGEGGETVSLRLIFWCGVPRVIAADKLRRDTGPIDHPAPG
ncbi:hypothetical protein O4H53_09215 [Sulfitobacter sp. G21635-S1]|nr:hypothetical protein [Sulfitobacter sp. G21635-S1]MCZ4255713.1 hypothetical protein [Sulfitobacter sp. G21635-S1]